QAFVSHTHGTPRYTELRRQVAPRRQARTGRQPPCLDRLADRRVDLRGERLSSDAIEVDGQLGNRSMVHSELPFSVLFMATGRHISSASHDEQPRRKLSWKRSSSPTRLRERPG